MSHNEFVDFVEIGENEYLKRDDLSLVSSLFEVTLEKLVGDEWIDLSGYNYLEEIEEEEKYYVDKWRVDDEEMTEFPSAWEDTYIFDGNGYLNPPKEYSAEDKNIISLRRTDKEKKETKKTHGICIEWEEEWEDKKGELYLATVSIPNYQTSADTYKIEELEEEREKDNPIKKERKKIKNNL